MGKRRWGGKGKQCGIYEKYTHTHRYTNTDTHACVRAHTHNTDTQNKIKPIIVCSVLLVKSNVLFKTQS